MPTRMKFSGRQDERRKFAAELAESRASRTDKQQLARLDKGGYRALRERSALNARIAARAGRASAASPADSSAASPADSSAASPADSSAASPADSA